MKFTAHHLLSIIFFAFFLLLSSQKSIAIISLSVDPDQAKRGDPVTVSISGVPQSNTTTSYDLTVIPSGSGQAGTPVASAKIIITNNTCRVERSPNGWSSTSCPSVDSQGNQLSTFRFTGVINTNGIGINSNSTTDSLFSVDILAGSGEIASRNFTVKADVQTSAFSITDVTPNPAKPGSNITISVSVESSAYLAAYIPKEDSTDIEGALSTSKFTKNNGLSDPYQLCSSPTCEFTLAVPDNILNTNLAVYIIELQSKAKINKIIGLVALTPLPTGFAGLTPTPTIYPPLPPACSKWVTLDTDEVIYPPNPKIINGEAKCMEVYTALGPISSDPSGFVTRVFGIILGLAGSIALLLIIYSGYKLLTSQGNAEIIQGAKETLTAAIVGLLFIIFTFVIFQTLTSDILHLPGF